MSSKWAEEFESQFKTVGKVKKLTEGLKAEKKIMKKPIKLERRLKKI